MKARAQLEIRKVEFEAASDDAHFFFGGVVGGCGLFAATVVGLAATMGFFGAMAPLGGPGSTAISTSGGGGGSRDAPGKPSVCDAPRGWIRPRRS